MIIRKQINLVNSIIQQCAHVRTTLYCLSLTLFLVFPGNAKSEIHNILTLNTTTNAPLSTPTQQGFLDKVAKEALKRLGINMKTLNLPAERALRDANAGILDGELSRVPGLEKTYKNLLLVPEKLMDLEFTVFSKNAPEIKPSWEGLKHTNIAFLNGWKILERNVPASAEVTKVKTPRQLFNLLKLNRVDYIIYERWGGIELAQSMNISNVKPLQPPLVIMGMHMYLHTKHKDLIDPLTLTIKAMKKDGTYQRIYNTTLKSLSD